MLADIIGTGGGPNDESIPLHQFTALLHWHAKDPVKMPAAKAKAILEAHLKRALTVGEVNELKVMKALDPREVEWAFSLKERGWISKADAKELLGLS